MTLQEKLDLWVKITGVHPDQKHFTIKLDDSLSSFDIKHMDDRIKDALSYDETGLFAEAYLIVYFRKYLQSCKMPLADITDPVNKEFIQDVSLLQEELSKSTACEDILEVSNNAMAFYDLHQELDIFDAIELRTSAVKCMDSLHLFQFKKGDTLADSFKVNKTVLMYRSLNDVLYGAVNGTIDGVSLAYIRDDKKLTDSYFAFVIKNGDNLYILTDKPVYKTPTQKDMHRCPGRDMSDRIDSNWFPYETFSNLDVSDLWNSGRYGVSENDTSLTTDERAAKLGTFSDMNKNEAFWTVMMLSLIKDKFYKGSLPELDISYTGYMIALPENKDNETAIAIQKNLPILILPEVTDPITTELKYDSEPTHDNDYLIDMYAKLDDIPEEIEVDPWGISTAPAIDPLVLNTSDCFTTEQAAYQQQWIARYNLAAKIKRLNAKDYADNHKKIHEWLYDKISTNLSYVIAKHLQSKFVSHITQKQSAFDPITGCDKYMNFSRIQTFDKWYNESNENRHHSDFLFSGSHRHYNKSDYLGIDGNKPCAVITITIETAAELASVIGCNVQDLPIQLQHIGMLYSYAGNNILYNLDPMDFVPDKWNDEMRETIVTIILSKQDYLHRCETALVPKNEFWLTETPVCFKPALNDKNVTICNGSRKITDTACWVLKKKCEKCKYFVGGEK